MELLRKDQAIEFVSEMPIILRWNQIEPENSTRTESGVYDVCDVNLYNREKERKNVLGTVIDDDKVKPTKEEENIENTFLANAKPSSHTSHTSHEKSVAIDVIEYQDKENSEKLIHLRHSSRALVITNSDLEESEIEDEELFESVNDEEGG